MTVDRARRMFNQIMRDLGKGKVTRIHSIRDSNKRITEFTDLDAAIKFADEKKQYLQVDYQVGEVVQWVAWAGGMGHIMVKQDGAIRAVHP